MIGKNNLISDPLERKKRQEINEGKILGFLKQEKSTTASIIAKLLGYTSVSPVYSILNRLIKKGFITQFEVKNFLSGKVNFYGITQLGVTMSLNEKDDPFSVRPFEPSHLNIATLRHRLDIQEIYILAKSKGYQWKSTSNIKLNKGEKYPDSLIRHNGIIYAVEVERTPKSPRRYKEIIEIYLNQMPANKWGKVLYLFPDSNMRDRVLNIFKRVDCAIVQGQRVLINEVVINQFFLFMTYDEFKNSDID